MPNVLPVDEARSAALSPGTLSPEDQCLLGEMWLQQGLAEHASVGSFARFALHLMGLGAPPHLLDEAARAMRDEIRHATLCFGVAARFRGVVASPGPLDLSGVLQPQTPLRAIVQSTIDEGCVGETVSHRFAVYALEQAEDGDICKTLREIVEDEARHCELAWQFLIWALEKHPELRPMAVEAFADATRGRATQDAGGAEMIAKDQLLARYGQPSKISFERIRREVIRTTIVPRAAEILRSPGLGELNQG